MATSGASWLGSDCWWWGSSLYAAETTNPIAVMIANSAMQAAAATHAVPNMNRRLACPISDWSKSASPSTTTNATTDVQKPKLTNRARTRRAADGAFMGYSG